MAKEAVLIFKTGKLEKKVGNSWHELKVKDVVTNNSTVRTKAKSMAIFELPGIAKIKLRANSVLVLQNLEKGNVFIELKDGGIFSKVVKQAPNSFKIKASSVVAGVRGTDFFTSYGQGADVWLCVNEGKVAIESLKTKKDIEVKAGEGVIMPDGAKLTKPKPFAWTKNLNWNMDPEKGEVKDETNLNSAYKDLLDQDYD